MNMRFVATTAIGVVLATASFAQSPTDQTRRQEQQRTHDQRTQSPATTGTAPSTSSSQIQSTPSTGSAQSTGSTAAQRQAPTASGTAQNQSAPSTTQATPANRQPSRDQAASPGRPSTNTTQSPESPRQPTTAQRPAQRTQQNTAQSPTNRPADNAQAPAQPRQSGPAQTTKSNTNVNASTNVSAQEQITRIAQSVARLNVQPLTNVNFSVAVGTVVPRDVRLQTLPPDIVRIVPEFRSHSFVVVQDDIVIIDPSTYRIVAVLPKSGGRTTAASSPAPRQAQAKATFTEKERAAIRKHTNVKRERVTIGSSGPTQLRAGERVPETVRILEFPETVYREVPSAREYRYIELENRSYLIEPREHVIIEAID